MFNSESQNNSMTPEKTIASSLCQMKDFLERFEESQKNNSVSNAKRRTPSFKPNPNYKGSVTNGKDKYMYFENKDNHTRTILVDSDNDGKIDEVLKFEYDKAGNVKSQTI